MPGLEAREGTPPLLNESNLWVKPDRAGQWSCTFPENEELQTQPHSDNWSWSIQCAPAYYCSGRNNFRESTAGPQRWCCLVTQNHLVACWAALLFRRALFVSTEEQGGEDPWKSFLIANVLPPNTGSALAVHEPVPSSLFRCSYQDGNTCWIRCVLNIEDGRMNLLWGSLSCFLLFCLFSGVLGAAWRECWEERMEL